jgi:hypothetical protein
MANGDPQADIAASVAASFDRPIAVSVINKLDKFPFLQQLGYNGQLSFMAKGFLGLQDFYDELNLYSSSSALLRAAWSLIKQRVPLNLDMQENMFQDPVLGQVGNAFQQIVGFDQVFAVDPDQLLDATGSSIVGNSLPTT